MKGNSFLVCAGFALLVLASPAFAQNDDELEVTLQVLDDVADIDGVVLSVGDADSSGGGGGRGAWRGGSHGRCTGPGTRR